jgi:hypothetical protein
MCCLGAPIVLLWRFRELPEDLASYGPLPGLLIAAASLLLSCPVVAFSVLLRSLHCCLFVAIFLPFAPSCGPCPLILIYSAFFSGPATAFTSGSTIPCASLGPAATADAGTSAATTHAGVHDPQCEFWPSRGFNLFWSLLGFMEEIRGAVASAWRGGGLCESLFFFL